MHEHVEMLQRLAAGRPGKLVIAGYGQDPETGQKLPAKVRSFNGDSTTAMVEFAEQLATEDHRNIYMPLAQMGADLEASRKGGEGQKKNAETNQVPKTSATSSRVASLLVSLRS